MTSCPAPRGMRWAEMHGAIQAFGIIFSVVLAASAIMFGQAKPRRNWDLTEGLLVGLLAGFACIALPPVWMDAANGTWQIFAPAIVCVVVGCAVGRRWVRICVIVVEVALAYGLQVHFLEVANHRGTGWMGVTIGMPSSTIPKYRIEVALAAYDLDHKNAALPAGWLDESPLRDAVAPYCRLEDLAPHRRVPVRAWHSWFTGLYAVKEIRRGWWYPGGPVANGIDRIELREKERRSAEKAGR